MRTLSSVVCMLLAGAACDGNKPRPTTTPPPAVAPVRDAPVVLDPRVPLRVEALGAPVRSARTWTTALVPNARGGWNFITQSWELHSGSPVEWVVVQLDTGKVSVIDAPDTGYANSNFQVRNQLRAPDGRVFFLLSGTGLAYYDPTDETVKTLPPVLPPGPDKLVYSATFGSDGMLYAGTQSNALPTIIQIDPKTLATRVVGHVGRDRKTYSYAYYLAVDPPWIYSAVGEMPWELAALNITTGESRILATRTERPWMALEKRPEGVRAQLVTGVHTPQAVSDYVWCVDGKALPVDPSGKLPFKARNVAPAANVPTGAPELDVSQINPDPHGVGRIRWRPAGATDWHLAEYQVKYTTPIKIEALTALPDGSVLGETAQYHGFFSIRGSASTFLGGPTPSQSVFALLDGTLYTTGYPNSVLYAYDPKQPWTGTTPESASVPGANPRLLGNFTQAGAKYAYFLVPAPSRLYFAGRLERDGAGTGVGYYEPATKQFGGQHDNLLDVEPAGLAVLPALQRVVLSERMKRGTAPAARLVVYDDELAETDRLVVKPELAETGLIYASPVPEVIVGVLPGAVYRYDIAAKKLLAWRDLAGAVTVVAPRPGDGSLWAVSGTALVRIDPVTLEAVTFATNLPAGVEHLVWQGDDLYGSVGADLYRFARVGLP